MRPSRARLASTRVPLASRPKSVATSLGDSSSTSVCHSTACHRSGSDRKARMAMDRSAWCIARTSAPSSSVSPSDTSGPCADWAAKTAKSSTSCSRRADLVQEAATRRTEVSRYARTACCGPEPPRTAWSMRAKTSAVRSSGVCASRQQVRAYRRTACAWRRYSSSYAVSSPERIRSMSSVSDGGRSRGGGRTLSSRRSRWAGTEPSAGCPPGGTLARPPWLGTCSSRPSALIAESPRQPPNPSRPPGQSATGALGRDPGIRTITHPCGFTARQY